MEIESNPSMSTLNVVLNNKFAERINEFKFYTFKQHENFSLFKSLVNKYETYSRAKNNVCP